MISCCWKEEPEVSKQYVTNEVASEHLKAERTMFKKFNYHGDVSIQEAPGSVETHKGAFDLSIGMRQEESWFCLANEALLCTINHSRFKAGNESLFQDLFFYCTNKHLGYQTTQGERGRPQSCANKGGRIGNVPLIFFLSSLVFSQRTFRLLQLGVMFDVWHLITIVLLMGSFIKPNNFFLLNEQYAALSSS